MCGNICGIYGSFENLVEYIFRKLGKDIIAFLDFSILVLKN
jgi:hypothetical protein